MIVTLLALALGAASAGGGAAERPQLAPRPAAAQLFERDWALMNWALKFYDRDGDILLGPGEAAAAAEAFRKLADGDDDGRVTQEEFRAARQFILSRY